MSAMNVTISKADSGATVILFNPAPTSHVFNDMVFALRSALEELKVVCQISCQLSTPDWYAVPTDSRIFVLFGAHNHGYLFNWRLKYIVFNYEQAGSPWMRLPNYQKVMKNAMCVWDYSYFNANFLLGMGVNVGAVIPFGYHSILTKPLLTSAVESTDVLFYGAPNPRRNAIMHSLRENRVNVKYISDYSCWDARLAWEIQRAKIVLNVHFYTEPSVLEQSRIAPLLANGKLIISERSDDARSDELFADCVVFCGEHEIATTCRQYLENSELRVQRAKSAFDKFCSDFSYSSIIRKSGALNWMREPDNSQTVSVTGERSGLSDPPIL